MASDKRAITQIPINEYLAGRWSPRAFAGRPVKTEDLIAILEAARWAPSCFNEQPWSFIVATQNEPGEFQKLLDCLMDGNKVWAQHAPVLMISVAKLSFDYNGKPNRHAFHDVGLAAMSLVIEARVRGLQVHQMGGFHIDKVREVYQVPATHEPVAAIAVGYEGSPEQLPEKLREQEEAPRQRKPLTELIFGKSPAELDALLGGS